MINLQYRAAGTVQLWPAGSALLKRDAEEMRGVSGHEFTQEYILDARLWYAAIAVTGLLILLAWALFQFAASRFVVRVGKRVPISISMSRAMSKNLIERQYIAKRDRGNFSDVIAKLDRSPDEKLFGVGSVGDGWDLAWRGWLRAGGGQSILRYDTSSLSRLANFSERKPGCEPHSDLVDCGVQTLVTHSEAPTQCAAAPNIGIVKRDAIELNIGSGLTSHHEGQLASHYVSLSPALFGYGFSSNSLSQGTFGDFVSSIGSRFRGTSLSCCLLNEQCGLISSGLHFRDGLLHSPKLLKKYNSSEDSYSEAGYHNDKRSLLIEGYKLAFWSIAIEFMFGGGIALYGIQVVRTSGRYAVDAIGGGCSGPELESWFMRESGLHIKSCGLCLCG